MHYQLCHSANAGKYSISGCYCRTIFTDSLYLHQLKEPDSIAIQVKTRQSTYLVLESDVMPLDKNTKLTA